MILILFDILFPFFLIIIIIIYRTQNKIGKVNGVSTNKISLELKVKIIKQQK